MTDYIRFGKQSFCNIADPALLIDDEQKYLSGQKTETNGGMSKSSRCPPWGQLVGLQLRLEEKLLVLNREDGGLVWCDWCVQVANQITRGAQSLAFRPY